jgi:hypothetical protein
MGIKNKTSRLIVAGVAFLVALAGIAPNVKGAAVFVLEPYGNIARMAIGTNAYQYVKRLTQDDMEGRQSGTEGCQKAADYIADQFKEFGLKPFQSSSYFQPCQVTYFNLITPLTFQFISKNQWITPHYREDFQVFVYSGEGKVANSCVFVGYGISSPERQFDEYEGISVIGKTALLMLDLPGFFKDKNDDFTIYKRIYTAYSKGASSVVILLKEGVKPPFRSDMKMSMGFNAKIPVILAHGDLSAQLMQVSSLSLEGLDQSIETSRKPCSILLDLELKIEVNVISETRTSNNVIGYIPAFDPSVKDSILITSHYDALGIDYIQQTIYHGANDNASSTGCIMEIARNLIQNHCIPAVNLVFIAFTGEEEGLLGSYHYVSDPLFPLTGIIAVINSEEIGTFDGVNVVGTSKSIYPELSKMISSSAKYLGIKTTFYPDFLYPGSDHYPFHEQGIPSVCFARLPIPGGYPEYHKRSDTIDIISPKSLEIFCQLITLMTLSYSESAYFDFSELSGESRRSHPFITTHVPCYLPSLSRLSVSVQHEALTLPGTGEEVRALELFIPLSKGSNDIILEIKYKNKAWITEHWVVSCHPITPLRADFNQDLRVDLRDLQLLGKKLDSPTNPYFKDSLYDLNQDQLINRDDCTLFAESFGYSSLTP